MLPNDFVSELRNVGPKGALLDMDGTITQFGIQGEVISLVIQHMALAKERGVSLAPKYALRGYLGSGHGKDYFELVRDNILKFLFESEVDLAAIEYRRMLPVVAEKLRNDALEVRDLDVPLVPYAVEGLKILKKQKIPVVVVTMTPGYLADAILFRAGLSQYVDAVIGCESFMPSQEDPRLELDRGFLNQICGLKKDNPELWNCVAQYFFNSNASDCFVAEDGRLGTRGAFLAGAKIMALLHSDCLTEVRAGLSKIWSVAEGEERSWSQLRRTELH